MVTMALTFACSFFVVRHVCYGLLYHGAQYESMTEAPTARLLLLTVPLLAAVVALGTLMQNLSVVMSVSGSLSAVLPTMCYLKICKYRLCFWRERGWRRKWDALKTVGPLCIAIFSTAFTLAQKCGVLHTK